MQLRAELGEGIKVSAAHRVCKRVGRSIDVSNLGDRGAAPEGREGDEAQVHELHQRGACGVAREHEGGREGVRERVSARRRVLPLGMWGHCLWSAQRTSSCTDTDHLESLDLGLG